MDTDLIGPLTPTFDEICDEVNKRNVGRKNPQDFEEWFKEGWIWLQWYMRQKLSADPNMKQSMKDD